MSGSPERRRRPDGLSLRHPLDTDRLILRPFEAADLEPLRDIYTLPEVVRYLYTDLWTPEMATAQLDSKITSRQLLREGDVLTLAIVPRGGDRLIGEVLLKWRSAAKRQGELGYVLHPESQGQGYATEAARVLLHLGFEELGLARIFARCDARNAASVAVMERLGMRPQPQLQQRERVKGVWSDTLIYALTPDR